MRKNEPVERLKTGVFFYKVHRNGRFCSPHCAFFQEREDDSCECDYYNIELERDGENTLRCARCLQDFGGAD